MHSLEHVEHVLLPASLLYDTPSTHEEQLTDPMDEEMLPAGQSKHWDWPWLLAYFPTGQELQLLLPAAEDVPGEQGVHAVEPSCTEM